MMKTFKYSILFSLVLFSYYLIAQEVTSPEQQTLRPNHSDNKLVNFARDNQSEDKTGKAVGEFVYNEILAPFYHGVASGDPLNDRVIIWTRVTPENPSDEIEVSWIVSSDPNLEDVIQTGVYLTSQELDFTVKIDVDGLEPGTTYYYGFEANGKPSLTGRTKTATIGEVDQLKFAVVSCQNYQSGYFNAYKHIADKNDLDAVLHLGDYIYEYLEGGYGYTEEVGRGHEPTHEILTLEDYRTRHFYYKLDPDLIRAHQQHPFVTIWDDHETANDSYAGGAENHDESTEGDWEIRKSNGKQAYFEWMPIRSNENNSIYRSIKYGDLAELILLDTRLEGRTAQVDSITDPEFESAERTILGETQKEWFTEKLINSTSQWKLIGNQVVFSPLLIAELVVLYPIATQILVDIWEGYPNDRNEIVDVIEENEISNIAFLTGDVHVTYAFDVAPEAGDSLIYNGETGEGSIAVEFVTPSISSDNYDEILGNTIAGLITTLLGNTNPHLKKINGSDHGFLLIDVTAEKLQGDWYYVEDKNYPTDGLSYGNGLFTENESNYLQFTDTPSPNKTIQEVPAPAFPPGYTGINTKPSNFAIFGQYPNPTSGNITLNYGLNTSGKVKIDLYDISGKLVKPIISESQPQGLYSLNIDFDKLSKGTYNLLFSFNGNQLNRTVIIQ